MPRLQIDLKPSKIFFIMALALILGAITSIFCCYLPYYIQLALAAAVLLYGSHLLWAKIGLKSPQALVSLVCSPESEWTLKAVSGRLYRAKLCGDSLRWPGLGVLRFITQDSALEKSQRLTVVIFYDALSPEAYRQLLMRLGTICN